MKDDWLNKNLEDKLGDYESQMNLENAWDSLQSKRQPQKKKNRFFFFWLIFGVMTIGSWGSYLVFNNQTDNIHNNTLTENKNQVELKTIPSTLAQTENSIAPLKTKTSNQSTNQLVPTLPSKPNESIEEKTFSSTSRDWEVDSKIPFSKKENPSNTDSNIPKQNAVKNILVIDSTIRQKKIQPFAVSFLPNLELSPLELYEVKHKLISNSTFFANGEIQNSTFVVGCIPPHSYFNISVGYGIRSKGKVFLQEDPLDVISINALFEKRFMNRKIYLKTGIIFDQFVNKTESTTQQNLTELRDNQLIAINHFQDGTTENVFGTANVSEIEMTTEKNYNRYRLVNIPLIMGYEILSSHRSNLQIEGGFAQSIFGFHSGKYFELADSNFEKRGVWQGLYGLNFNFKIGQNSHLFTSARGNYHFNKIGKSDQLEIEKFRFHQIQLGIRFKL